MSNKTLILILSFFMVALILVGIVFNKNFSGITEPKEEKEEIEKPKKEIKEEIKITENDATIGDYEKLEAKLRSAGNKYIKENEINSEYKTVISFDELKNKGYIEELNDPKTDTSCRGYIIIENNNIDSYVKCSDNYMTTNYNESLE